MQADQFITQPIWKPAAGTSAGSLANIICLKPSGLIGASTLPGIDSADTLVTDSSLTAPSEVVAGLLHASTKGVLAGSSKVGKTWLLLDLAVSVANGAPFLRRPTTSGKVLFINFEIPRVFIKQRLQTICAKKELPDLKNLNLWTLRGRSSQFGKLLDEMPTRICREQYSLIILDPIYKLLNGSENTATAVNSMSHQIEKLVENTGAAVVYAHHFTKGNASKKKAMDRMSGSGTFARDADTIVTLTEHKEENCYTVEMVLRNLPPQAPFVVQWVFPVMVERPDLDPTDLKASADAESKTTGVSLLDLLENGPLTTGQWQKAAEEEGCSRATFFRKREMLQADNQVTLDPKSKTWTRTGEKGLKSQISPAETCETDETTDVEATVDNPK